MVNEEFEGWATTTSVIGALEALTAARLEIDQLINHHVRPLGMTAAGLQCLYVLAGAGEPMSVEEVARRRGVHRTSVRSVIAELERRRLVTVERSDVDARQLAIWLTSQGERAMRSAALSMLRIELTSSDPVATTLAAWRRNSPAQP